MQAKHKEPGHARRQRIGVRLNQVGSLLLARHTPLVLVSRADAVIPHGCSRLVDPDRFVHSPDLHSPAGPSHVVVGLRRTTVEVKRKRVKIEPVCLCRGILDSQVEHLLEKVRVGKEVQATKEDCAARIGFLGCQVANLEQLVVILRTARPEKGPVFLVPDLPDFDSVPEAGDRLIDKASPIVVRVIPGQM